MAVLGPGLTYISNININPTTVPVMKQSLISSFVTTVLVVVASAFHISPASAAYPTSCTVEFLAEANPYPNNTPNVRSTTATLTATETSHTVTLEANATPMNSFLMYITERDCPVNITSVTVTDDSGAKSVDAWNVFDGTSVSGSTFEWPSAAQSWAGFASNTPSIYPLNISGGATVTIVGRTKPEVKTEEELACEDTSVRRFEDAFGNATVTCLTDTYTWPTGAETWAGFGDTARAASDYPLNFPYGGSITFTGSAATPVAVSFQFENEPFPNNSVIYRTASATVQANQSYTIEIPAPDPAKLTAEQATTTFNNMLLYVETRDVPVVLTNITVTENAAPETPVVPPVDPAPPAEPAANAIPALPAGALLGLVGLVAWIGWRRRAV